jgi:hypothetical protein
MVRQRVLIIQLGSGVTVGCTSSSGRVNCEPTIVTKSSKVTNLDASTPQNVHAAKTAAYPATRVEVGSPIGSRINSKASLFVDDKG